MDGVGENKKPASAKPRKPGRASPTCGWSSPRDQIFNLNSAISIIVIRAIWIQTPIVSFVICDQVETLLSSIVVLIGGSPKLLTRQLSNPRVLGSLVGIVLAHCSHATVKPGYA